MTVLRKKQKQNIETFPRKSNKKIVPVFFQKNIFLKILFPKTKSCWNVFDELSVPSFSVKVWGKTFFYVRLPYSCVSFTKIRVHFWTIQKVTEKVEPPVQPTSKATEIVILMATKQTFLWFGLEKIRRIWNKYLRRR